MWRFTVLLVFLLPAVSAAAGFPALAHWQKQHVSVTALAVNLNSGKTLASLNAKQRLIPASLSKLFTASLALHQWGVNKSFTTRLKTNGRVNNGTLEGNLILEGGGDPGLVSQQLWPLIAQLKAAGIRHISGDLIVDASLFGKLDCITVDRCQSRHHSHNAYDANLSSAGINYGSWCLKVTPADSAKENAEVATCPVNYPRVAISADVATVHDKRALTFRRTTHHHQDRLQVRGQIGADQQPAYLYVSSGNVSRQAGLILAGQMALAGITLAGKVRVTYQPTAGRELASVNGLPLDTLVKRMMRYSNNYMADTLTLDLALANQGILTNGLVGASEHLQNKAQEFLAPYQLDSGIVPAKLASGSGLTTQSRLSAKDIVTLLGATYQQTAIFPAFVSALTVPAYSPLGILRGPEADWQNRVMVKSGSLNEPYTVYGIAGYARARSGDWIAFAILLNGSQQHPVLPYTLSMKRLRHAVTQLLDN